MSAVMRAGRGGVAGAARRRAAPARAAAATVKLRLACAADYPLVAAQVDAWSRGRFVAAALPQSFFEHFADTSLLLLEAGQLAGVLVGFRSQARPQVACVHFVAVAPGRRGQGHGRALVAHFLERAQSLGCEEVHSLASPLHSSLIAFHRQLGFEVVDGGRFHCGIAVFADYAGPGQHRVLFRKRLEPAGHAPGL
jgi:N-acetylglutamate synthase-like GNAT family acetyltransferase